MCDIDVCGSFSEVIQIFKFFLMQGLSKFEIERLERIRRNNEYLKELGLDDEKPFVRKKRRTRKKKTSEEPVIRRRSYVFFIPSSHPLASTQIIIHTYVTLELQAQTRESSSYKRFGEEDDEVEKDSTCE